MRSTLSRLSIVCVLGSTAAILGACSSAASAVGSSRGADSTGGAADTDCRIVLREAGTSTLFGGETYTDPSSLGGPSFVVFRGVIDVDTQLVAAGASVTVWYQGQGYAPVTVEATACSGDCEQGLDYLNGGQSPPTGFTRYSFATQANTVEAGTDGYYLLQLIPFVTLAATGVSLYDHNRVSGNYTLGGEGAGYAVSDDFSICPAPDPQGLVSPAPTQDAGQADASGATVVDDQSMNTGLGNKFEMQLALAGEDDDGTSSSAAYGLTVIYTDSTGYMKDASGNEPASLSAYVGVDLRTFTAGGDPGDTVQNNTITLAQRPDGTYANATPLTITVNGSGGGLENEVIWSLSYAFWNASGAYDSNESANYTITATTASGLEAP
jgi:hypothetical protein